MCMVPVKEVLDFKHYGSVEIEDNAINQLGRKGCLDDCGVRRVVVYT